MKPKISKSEVEKQIKEFFKKIREKSPKEIKKIKELAMNKKIPLKEKRKLFCKKCFTPYKNPKIRIKNNLKSVVCENCGEKNNWKINFS